MPNVGLIGQIFPKLDGVCNFASPKIGLKIINCSKLNYKKKLSFYFNKSSTNNKFTRNIVSKILQDLKAKGDQALIKYIKKYEGNNFKAIKEIKITKKEINYAKSQCSKSFLKALGVAIKRVYRYQEKLMPKNLIFKDATGMKLGCLWTPLDSCGLYVPGGKAFYPSSVVMNAVPAKLAGVKRVIITTPAINNEVKPEILAASSLIGIEEIYKVGGAQAIGAMTYGTNLIKKVDKIVGPGNSFVAEAKRQVFGEVGIDSVAGPSEIMVIADSKNNSKFIAMDLLSQAEHDEAASAILVTDSKQLADSVKKDLQVFLKTIDRKKIAEKSLRDNGLIIIIPEISMAYKIANFLAPEHLEIMTKKKYSLLNKIKNAGAVFLGEYTPESLGDYVAGPSHVLPTSGNARFESGLSVLDFFKRTSMIEADKSSLKKVSLSIETLAKAEGLDAHMRAASIRFSVKRKS